MQVRATAWTIHAVFVAQLLLIVGPSRFVTWFPAAASTANTVGTLFVWLALWRLCAARQLPVFLASAVIAVFLSAFRSALVGLAICVSMLTAHLYLVRAERRARAGSNRPADDGGVDRSDDGPGDAGDAGTTPGEPHAADTASVEIIDLHAIARPYGRLLVAVRTLRASIASTLAATLIFGADMLRGFGNGGDDPVLNFFAVIIAGIVVLAVLVAILLLFFKMLRSLWAGSVPALWGWFIVSVVVLPWAAVGLYLDTPREELLDGRVWFRAIDFARRTIFFIALAIGTAFIVRRHRHPALLALLRENRRRDWRTALLQLCGVIWPRQRGWTAWRNRSVRWSVLAFALEGAAFLPISGTESSQALAALPPIPPSLGPLAGHYVSLAAVVCLFATGLFVWTQFMFRLADLARSRAQRAALRPADEARRADQRAPVLFLRSFEDDQVSLRPTSVSPLARIMDPAFALAHLEGVVETCLSLGPVIAIGRPGDLAPPVGVSRLYVANAAWRKVVLDLMAEAALVVVGTSRSEGVIWEIEQLRQRHYLDKTVFVVSPVYARDRRFVDDLLNRLLRETNVTIANADDASGRRSAVAVICRSGRPQVFVTSRGLSQVHYEIALRLGVTGLA